MRKIDFRRVFLVASLSSLVLTYALLWLRMITTPLEYTGTDFVTFYAATRIVKNEGASHVYDVALQQKYEQALIGEKIAWELVRIYLNPPFVVPLASLVSLDGFVRSLILWDGMMLVFLVCGSLLLIPLLCSRFSRKEWLLLLAGILLFFPAYKSLVVGQSSAILYLGVCAWMAGVLLGKDWLGGLGLAVMTVRPHLALPLVLPFLFSRRRGVWWWFLAGTVVLAGFSLAYMGKDGVEGFLNILIFSGSGANLTTGENNMLNLIGLLLRLLPGVPAATIRGVGWGVYLLVMLALCIAWRRTPQIGERQISLAVLLCMFTAPHLHLHDFVILVVPMVSFFMLARGRNIPAEDLALVAPGISLVMLLSFVSFFLQTYVPYLVMLCLFLLVWFPEKIFLWKKRSKMGLVP